MGLGLGLGVRVRVRVTVTVTVTVRLGLTRERLVAAVGGDGVEDEVGRQRDLEALARRRVDGQGEVDARRGEHVGLRQIETDAEHARAVGDDGQA